MGQFACIQFNQDKILTSKRAIATIEDRTCLNRTIYQVDVPLSQEALTPKQWGKLEEELERYAIEYICLEGTTDHQFARKVVITKEGLRPYLAQPILDYIKRYNLCHKDRLFWKVGLIVGHTEQMMGVLGSIMHDVSDLTLFSETPYMYKDLIQEIYEATRLKAKCVVPCSAGLGQVDVVFDCEGRRDYAKWCHPNTIYIDFNHYYRRHHSRFMQYPPMIWDDFEIICGKQTVSLEILQGILKSEGISKRSIPLTFKQLDLRVTRPYNVCMS